MFHRFSLLVSGLAIAAAACGDNNNKPNLVLTATSIDFGEVDCGTTAAAQAFVVANTGVRQLTYTATLAGGAASPFSVTPPAGVVVAQGELEVLVTPKAVASDGGIAPLTDTLTLTTDVPGDQPHSVPITLTPHGVVITVSTASVAFTGPKKVGLSAGTQPLTISNAGNADSTVTVASIDDSFAVDETAATVAAGASVDRPVTFEPFGSGSLSSQLAISATGPLCKPVPTATATGTGTFVGTAADVLLVGAQQFRQNPATLCVLLIGGQVACVGSNTLGARGPGPGMAVDLSQPNVVRTHDGTVLDGVVQLAGQRAQVCARRSEGSVWCWGNIGGAQAKGATGQPYASTLIDTGATSIAASYGFMCAMVNGDMKCLGQRANRWTSSNPASWAATGTAVSLNGCGGYALQSDGSVLAFGSNTHGVRGNTDPDNAPASAVTGLTGVVQVAGGPARGSGGTGGCGGACAVVNDGSVWCWGSGRHGKNGDGTTTDRNAPVQVMVAGATPTPLAGATKIGVGRHHRCAITTTGVYCWGRGDNGELGAAAGAETTTTALPTDTAITNAVAITANGRSTCLATSDGGVTCFGASAFGAADAFNP